MALGHRADALLVSVVVGCSLAGCTSIAEPHLRSSSGAAQPSPHSNDAVQSVGAVGRGQQSPASDQPTDAAVTALGGDVFLSLPHWMTARLRIERAKGAEPGFTRQALMRSDDWADSNVPGTAPASILLRKVTDTEYGPVDSTGEVVQPIINDRLVWVIADADAVVCAASGGPFNPNPPPHQRPIPLCGDGAFLTLIDARDGKFLSSSQGG